MAAPCSARCGIDNSKTEVWICFDTFYRMPDSGSSVFDLVRSQIPNTFASSELDCYAITHWIYLQLRIWSKIFHHSITSVIKFVIMTQRMCMPYSATMTVVKLFHYFRCQNCSLKLISGNECFAVIQKRNCSYLYISLFRCTDTLNLLT